MYQNMSFSALVLLGIVNPELINADDTFVSTKIIIINILTINHLLTILRKIIKINQSRQRSDTILDKDVIMGKREPMLSYKFIIYNLV